MQKLANNIWIAEGDIVDFHGFPYPTRSVIVRLANSDLWCWSPTALTPELKTAIDEIGEPKRDNLLAVIQGRDIYSHSIVPGGLLV